MPRTLTALESSLVEEIVSQADGNQRLLSAFAKLLIEFSRRLGLAEVVSLSMAITELESVHEAKDA